LKIHFLADENLRRAVVLGVRRREPGISFLQAFELGAEGKEDPRFRTWDIFYFWRLQITLGSLARLHLPIPL
jgi:hypothetical protein